MNNPGVTHPMGYSGGPETKSSKTKTNVVFVLFPSCIMRLMLHVIRKQECPGLLDVARLRAARALLPTC